MAFRCGLRTKFLSHCRGPHSVPLSRLRFEDLACGTGDGHDGSALWFAGGMYDPDTGLVRFRARDYDPVIGRWTGRDLLLFRGGDTNLYACVSNDPINFVDPFGYMQLPADPSGLGPEWVPDPTHLDPNGERFVNPNGDVLDFHRGRPGERGRRGGDHWHHNGDDEHLRPGDEIPDSPSVCEEGGESYPGACQKFGVRGRRLMVLRC